MFTKLKIVTVLSLLAVLVAGCADEQQTLRVGSKNFAESMILAEMIAQLAENEGIPVERKIPFGGTLETMEAAKQDVIDVYPEYNGTGLIFLGKAPTSDGEASTKQVVDLFEPLGLVWKGKYGFSNDYVIVTTAENAQELGLSKISDLAGTDTPVKFAIDEEFSGRAADGFRPMLLRYGIDAADPVVYSDSSEGKDQTVSALLDGDVEAAELFATDGQIAEYNLVTLEDDLKFFPVYEPSPLVRADALAAIPALGGVLDKLTGVINASDMQAMNKAVDLDAQTPAAVATVFLIDKGLLPETAAESEIESVVVAADPGVGRSSETARALRAIRAGFIGSNIEVVNYDDPLQALSDGHARVAMVGAEDFYTIGEDGPVARDNARAFAVLGFKTGHLITRKSGGAGSITDMKTIATGPEGTGSARVLDMLLTSLGLAGDAKVVHTEDSLTAQIESLTKGDYDGVFVMATTDDRKLENALDNTAVKLVGLDEWAEGGHTAEYSFIRPSTIPAQTYPLQFQPIASISTQYVLASPVETEKGTGDVGPGTAGVASAVPVGANTVEAVNTALSSPDSLDPAIPIHGALTPVIETADRSLPFNAEVSVMNILIILFTIWVIYLCTLPSPRNLTLPDDK